MRARPGDHRCLHLLSRDAVPTPRRFAGNIPVAPWEGPRHVLLDHEAASRCDGTKSLKRFPPGIDDTGNEGNAMRSLRTERLLRETARDPASSTVATKCAAGLAVLTLLAAIGAGTTDIHPVAGAGYDPVRVTEAENEGARAVAHRKALFDERRARFDGMALENRSAMLRRLGPGAVVR